MDSTKYRELVATVQGLIYEKAVLAQDLGLIHEGSGDGHHVGMDLVGPQSSMDLWFDPIERPYRWRLRADIWPAWSHPWEVLMPWDGRRAGWVRNVNNRQHELATPDELVELIALLRNMQPTIAGGAEFGLVHQLKFIAFFNSAAFTREGATFRAIQGLTIPGITDESDHMKRLSNFWRVLRQGDLYSLRGREITDHAPRKFMCAGGGRSWVEYVEPRWGKAHPLFALGVPYYDYTFAPMAYVPTDKTRREEL